MAIQRTSEVEPALLEAIQHARFHRKVDIALSLAFALERHRIGLAGGTAPPWVVPQADNEDTRRPRFPPTATPGGRGHGKGGLR